MTRECMYCGANCGEKCPYCGTENLTFFRSHEDGETFKIFICLNSCCSGKRGGHLAPQFREGCGPKGERPCITHTICDKCSKKPESERMAIYRRRQAGQVQA